MVLDGRSLPTSLSLLRVSTVWNVTHFQFIAVTTKWAAACANLQQRVIAMGSMVDVKLHALAEGMIDFSLMTHSSTLFGSVLTWMRSRV